MDKPQFCNAQAAQYKVRLHIPLQLLNNLAKNQAAHSNTLRPLCKLGSCVSVMRSDNHPLPNKKIEDAPQQAPVSALSTPFDINLVDKLTLSKAPHGSSTSIQIADGENPVIIEVILDDSTASFIKDEHGTYLSSITQADLGDGMFACAPTISSSNGLSMLTVRAIPKAGKGMFGGLNIGVQFPQDKAGHVVMPMFIDPQVKNSG